MSAIDSKSSFTPKPTIVKRKIVVTNLQDLLSFLNSDPEDAEKIGTRLQEIRGISPNIPLKQNPKTTEIKNGLSALISAELRPPKLLPKEQKTLTEIINRFFPF